MTDLLVTENMDGENTIIHRGGSHTRSPDSRYHPSRKKLPRNLIPEAQRILVRRPRQNPVRLDKISISLDVIAGLKLETQVAGT